MCLPKKKGIDFKNKFSSIDPSIIEFLQQCLTFNPMNRISVEEAIQNPIFDNIRLKEYENLGFKKVMATFEDIDIKSEEELRSLFLKEIFNN